MTSTAERVRSCAIRLAMTLVLTMVVSGTSEAQIFGGAREERPNRALFGGGIGPTEHQLIFSGSLGLGRDRLVFPASSMAEVFRDPRETSFGSGSASLSYALSRSRFTFGGGANASARYAPGLSSRTADSYSTSLSSSVDVASRTAMSGSFALSYQPLSALSLFPDMFGAGGPPIPTDYELGGGSTENYTTSSGAVGLSQELSSRSSLSFGYNYQHSPETGSRPAQSSQGASARYSHELARGLSMRLGYGRRIGVYSAFDEVGDRTIANQTIDAGVDFSRALSFSRRTSLSFSTGSAIVSDAVTTRYDLVGNASLNHEIGRSWTAALAYSRRVGFVYALAEPTFSDSISASVGGLLARRVSVSSGVGASMGSVGLSGDANGYRALQATASLQVGLIRTLGLGLGYVYYRYRFDTIDDLPSGIGTRLNRQTVQASLAVWLPLFHRARSSDAAR